MVDAWIAFARASGSAEFWWSVAALATAVGASGWHALRQLGHKRLMENLPTSLIRSAAQGYVELQGHALLIEGDPIVAALTGQSCAWYRYRVERRERDTDPRGHTRTRWHTIDQGVSEHLFALRDGTGMCVVDPDGARVLPSCRNVWYGNSRLPPRVTATGRWSRYLGLAGFGRSYRYLEERIAIGAPLYALGFFRSHAGSAVGPDPTEVASLLREWKNDRAELVRRFDTNRDGTVDAQEWEAARGAAERELGSRRRPDLPPAVDTLVDTGDARRPFVIAAATESVLAGRATRDVWAFGVIAVLGTVTIAWMIALRCAA